MSENYNVARVLERCDLVIESGGAYRIYIRREDALSSFVIEERSVHTHKRRFPDDPNGWEIAGSIKFDGCVNFETSPAGYTHICGPNGWKVLLECFAILHRTCTDYAEDWNAVFPSVPNPPTLPRDLLGDE